MATAHITQNSLLMSNLMQFYDQADNLDNMLSIINGDSSISLRIVDWFATNYSKQYFITYATEVNPRFKVYVDYKLKLRAYSKKRFDPFCRWDRISIPYKDTDKHIQTTSGQLNFFKWALENNVIKYIKDHYSEIEADMNARNSTSKRRRTSTSNKTRKKREELSVSASKTVHREDVEIIVSFK